MKAGWQTKRLGEVIRLEYGKPLPDESRKEDGKYPVYGANGEKCRTDLCISDKPSIIVGRKGSAGELNLTENRFWALDVTYYVDFDETVFSLKFLYNLLNTLQLPKLAKGVKPGLNRNEVYSIKVPIPPLPEQHRIVAILDEAFAGIATATANAERNLSNAREVFESYLESIFTAKGEAADWAAKSFSEVMEISSVLVDPRDGQYLEMLHVGGGNIESKTGRLVDLKTAREEGLISGKFVFDETMVLYSKIRPYLMKVARPDFKGLCSADIYPLSVKMGKLDRNFLYYLLLSPAFTEYAIAGSARAGMPKVNRDHLFAYRCQLPSLAKQMEYAAKLDELSGETQKLESIYQQKHTALNELKQSVLHQAFSGQLH